MLVRLNYQPGVDTERSATTMRGGWVSSNLMRFREGMPEKLLGWQAVTATNVAGVARALHYWSDLTNTGREAIGTNSQLYIVLNGVVDNITPSGWPGGFPSSPSSATKLPFSLLVWSLDNFGQDLIAIPSAGPVYVWPPTLLPTLATQITQAPNINQGGYVAMPQEIIIAYGCSAGASNTGDAMLVRWCDQQDFTDWTPSVTNQAGSFRLSRGNRIVGGLSSALGQFLWTDLDLWSVQYLGFPLVFGFTITAANNGLIAQKAVTAISNQIIWMSDHGFFSYSAGGVNPIPCTVWDQVYLNLDSNNQDKCVAGADQHHNEVFFFYPSLSGGTGEIDSYVKWNYLENLWDFGPATPGQANLMSRTAWTDQNQPGSPYSIDLTGLMQQQDTGVDANGAAMTGVMFRSGYMDITDGGNIIFFDWTLPDAVWTASTAATPTATITFFYRNFAGDTPTALGPFAFTPNTEYLTTRGRGREVAIQINVDGLGSWLRLGTFRVRAAPDGKI